MSYAGPPTPPQDSRRNHSGWMLLAIFLGGYAVAQFVGNARARRRFDPNATPKTVVARGDLAEDEKATIELFRQHSPAVVFITTARIGFDIRRFDETTLSQGTGSGFIWDENGYIVTNDHVISGANIAQVTMFDQTVWRAKLVGRASGKDLAVLKIDVPSNRLQEIVVGSSSDLLVGQKVFAIGNPFGLDHTLTTGVISALDREISASEVTNGVQTQRTIEGVIQTDAAINPGNSGGPLLDSEGRLIGVNTAIYSPSGAYAGVGFAIPADTVNRIVPQLIRHGRVIRPDIGAIPFRDQMTRQLSLKGVLVREVKPGSAAQAAGLQGTRLYRGRRILFGDLIIGADDIEIKDINDWFTFLEGRSVGQRVELTIVRDLQTSNQRTEKVVVALDEPAR